MTLSEFFELAYHSGAANLFDLCGIPRFFTFVPAMTLRFQSIFGPRFHSHYFLSTERSTHSLDLIKRKSNQINQFFCFTYYLQDVETTIISKKYDHSDDCYSRVWGEEVAIHQ